MASFVYYNCLASHFFRTLKHEEHVTGGSVITSTIRHGASSIEAVAQVVNKLRKL